MRRAVGDSAGSGSDTTDTTVDGCGDGSGDPGRRGDAFRRVPGDDPANDAVSGRMSRDEALYAPAASVGPVETIVPVGGVL